MRAALLRRGEPKTKARWSADRAFAAAGLSLRFATVRLLRTGASRFDLLLAFRGDGAKLDQGRRELIKQRLQLVKVA
jgi:hypothetical protein